MRESRRVRRFDVILALLLAAWAVAEALAFDSAVPAAGRVAFGLLATVPLAWRRLAPIEVAAWTVAVFLLDTAVVVLPVDAVTPLPAVPVALYALVAYGEPRHIALRAGLLAVPGIPAVTAVAARDAPVTTGDIVSLAAVTAVATLTGWVVRGRRDAAEREARAAAAARQDRRLGLRETLLAERLRIAGELRAIVARDIDDMAAALGDVTASTSPQRLRAIAERVSRIASDAVVEMQRLLRVLRDGGEQDVRPVTVEGAVTEAAARGWRVTTRERGDAASTAPGAVMALARLVEELLDGPPGPAVDLRVVHRAGGLTASVRGRSPEPSTLRRDDARARLCQRARLHGGRLRLRRRGRGWSVTLRVVSPETAGARERGVFDAVVLGLGATAVAADASAGAGGWSAAVLIAGAVLVVGPLAVRRRYPLATALVLAAGLLAAALTDVLPERPYTIVVAASLGAASVATHAVSRRQAIVGGVALGLAAVASTALTFGDDAAPTDLPIVGYLTLGAWLIGWATRTIDGTALRARARDEWEAAEHGAQVRAALDDERRAVARDLHDLVAHGVSLVAVLAGAAQATASRDPARARAELASAGHAVLDTRRELSRLTAMLRSRGDDPPSGRLADLDALVEQARLGGQVVTLVYEGVVEARASRGVVASAYRIVQEALTNARKHAPGAPVAVRLAASASGVDVSVSNPVVPGAGPGAGARHGIAGMQERARLIDGDLSAGVTAGGEFVVRAHLPFPPDPRSEITPNGAPGESAGQRAESVAPHRFGA